ncbi:hypothetical protein BCR35DRAFT_39369 [Leucosporidium creatinivorum]|uniref:Uncharacterized protein n=1 Tax=Leucosporidium creatinivorum TaxID=106004 RepID=A0A1Y2FTX0_9BASI|nr:hypothetical protein BCR35DRAFT_39369 [Leucosporidium creatinivorum]
MKRTEAVAFALLQVISDASSLGWIPLLPFQGLGGAVFSCKKTGSSSKSHFIL